jgi:hypothetical protein
VNSLYFFESVYVEENPSPNKQGCTTKHGVFLFSKYPNPFPPPIMGETSMSIFSLIFYQPNSIHLSYQLDEVPFNFFYLFFGGKPI